MPARLVFAGTPEFAVASLRALLDAGHDVVAVYTQPDRAAGRGRQLATSPVKQLALQRNIPLRQPATLTLESEVTELRDLAPSLMVVAAYGLILPSPVLAVPQLGCINVHASLLPRWRGAAPIARAIEAGDTRTGISLMQMDAGLDTGPVLARAALDITANDTAASLHDRMAELGGSLLIEHLPAILAGELTAQPQDDSAASYADKLKRSEAPVDWSAPAATVANKIRALNPWPVAEAVLAGQRLRLWHATVQVATGHGSPGTVLAVDKAGVDVACGEGCVRLTLLQRLGGKVLPAADFLNGFPIKTGARFE